LDLNQEQALIAWTNRNDLLGRLTRSQHWVKTSFLITFLGYWFLTTNLVTFDSCNKLFESNRTNSTGVHVIKRNSGKPKALHALAAAMENHYCLNNYPVKNN